MRVLIAPDKFKGSLQAEEVCNIIHSALQEANGDLEVAVAPLADGGEGTADILTKADGGSFVEVMVKDPLWRNLKTTYGISADGSTAFIEMARASGLQLLQPAERNPLLTTSFGTGQLIANALEHGVAQIVLGIGGSATNDAGIGMARALGFEFFDKDGIGLSGIGENLLRLHHIVGNRAHPSIQNTQFVVLCDVDNPLHGRQGAALVFAEQKGADKSGAKELDDGLKKFEMVARDIADADINFPGAGAAGGMGAGAKLFLNAQFRRGIDYIMEYINLEQKVMQADVVITGEGKIDTQTLSGKVVKGVADLAVRHNKELILVCGVCELENEQLHRFGAQNMICLSDHTTTVQQAIAHAKEILFSKTKKWYFERR